MQDESGPQIWKTSRREIRYADKTLIMGILNITPDSFSDGGRFLSLGDALDHAEKLIADGADILDIGAESTRPNGERVSEEEELCRVLPVLGAIAERFDIPISLDTSKSQVAAAAIDSGAEIINDISGLRFDKRIAHVAGATGAGLVLMHSRGSFEDMHRVDRVEDILPEVAGGFRRSIDTARAFGVSDEQICLDIGIGFSKTFGQNLELIGKLDEIREMFSNYPFMVGVSRKSFIGKIMGDAPVSERLSGSLAANIVSVWNGANILRVHDVRETAEAVRVVDAIKRVL